MTDNVNGVEIRVPLQCLGNLIDTVAAGTQNKEINRPSGITLSLQVGDQLLEVLGRLIDKDNFSGCTFGRRPKLGQNLTGDFIQFGESGRCREHVTTGRTGGRIQNRITAGRADSGIRRFEQTVGPGIEW